MFSSALTVGKPSTLRVNVLFIGQHGSGKNTLLRCVAMSYSNNITWTAATETDASHAGVHIQEMCSFYHASSAGDCKFHFYDCVGFGDFINNQASVEYIEKYLVDAHHDWLSINVNRIPEQDRNLSDKRIHLVISVSAPAAPHMLMVECWRKLHRLASIVPVIMKADTLTPEELVKLRDNYRGVIRDLSSGADQGIMFSFEDVPQPVDNGVGTETSGIMETEQTDDTQSETTDQHFHDGCINVLTSSLTPFSESSEMVQSAVMVSSQVSPAPESPQVGDYPISMEEIAYPSGLVMESTISADSFDMHPNTVGSTATYLNTMESTSPATADIFAVVCTLQQSHKRVYAWAAVDSFDENVSDFRKLLRLIFESGKLALLRSRCQEMSMRLLSSLPNKEEPISARVGGGRMIGYVSRWKNHLCNFFVLTFLAGTSAYLMKTIDWSSIGLWVALGTGLAALIDLVEVLSVRLELHKQRALFGIC